MGTLIQKIQCHEMPSTTAPPTIGPSATPVPLMPDQMPSAAPRRFGREGVGEQGQGQRGDDRAADALQRPGGDERAGGRRQRRGGARGGEERKADEEQPAAAEAVAERGARDEHDRERERVGVDRPLQRLQRGAEVRADRRQRDGDDEVVEHDHEERQRDDRERGAGAGLLRGG